MERLLKCDEVAERYGVKVKTVWEWIRTGKLEAFSTGKIYRVSEKHLKEFEKRNSTKGVKKNA